MDLYTYAGKSTYEFKLIRPVWCPSVLLAIKGQKDKFLHTNSWGFLFVGWWLDLFMPQIGKVLIISGIVMLTVGVFLVFFSDKIKWFGNLPLDFSYKSDSTRFYAPIGSMILLSAVLSIVANIFYRFFK